MKCTAMLTREEALAGRRWFVIDARDRVLGRVATEAANLLRGKGKASFTPHVDCGDFVVIVNAEQVKLTGPKDRTKVYYRHSGFPGGIRSQTAEKLRAAHPERLLRIAVTGMLPKNRLGRRLATKLKIYAGPEHPHTAQQPIPVVPATSVRS
jgi:large subunit ribosomal protein L13